MLFIKNRNFNGSYLRMKCPHPNPPPPPQPARSLPEAEGASRTGVSWDFGSPPACPPPPEGHRKLPAKAGTEFQVPGFYCAVSTVPVSHRDAPTCLGDPYPTGMHPHALGISSSQLKPSSRLTERTSSIHLHFHWHMAERGGGRDQSGRVFLCDLHPGLVFLSTSP